MKSDGGQSSFSVLLFQDIAVDPDVGFGAAVGFARTA